MIYLIDDNQNNQRQNNYNITYIEEKVFDGFLVSIEKIKKNNDLKDISHLDFLKSADCILLHSTTEDYDEENGFLSGSTTNVEKITNLISDFGEKIPLVLFSNSMGEPKSSIDGNSKIINGIKKNVFYEHLYEFLKHYKNTGEIELKIIAWGKNFISKEVSDLAYEILKSIDSKINTKIIEISDISNILKIFQRFIKLSFPNTDTNEIIFDIEDSPITVIEFKNKINKITESYIKYGKNIYSW